MCMPDALRKSVKVPLPLLIYTNGGGPFPRGPFGDNSCFGTIRSRLPSPLMSPQIGLPHVLVLIEIIPASVEKLVNCWARDTDEKRAKNPTTVARSEVVFFRPNGTRHNSRGRQSVDLINNINRGLFIRRLFYRVWDNLKQNTTTAASHLQSFYAAICNYETFHPSAIGPSWSSELQKSEACGAEQLGIEALRCVAAMRRRDLSCSS